MVVQDVSAYESSFPSIGTYSRIHGGRSTQEIKARIRRERLGAGLSRWEASTSPIGLPVPPQWARLAGFAGHEPDPELVKSLKRRLNDANRHFRRKAAAVFNDDAALTLLATLYESVVVETEDFDFCEHGRSLAKLAAANFCEIGSNGIFITESGQRFIDNINAT